MSDDRINIAVLEDFVKKVRLAAKGGQKELRIPITDAENLVHNLSIVTLKLLDKQQTSTRSTNEETITIAMDGGVL
jgi:hypothetical protein